MPVTATSYLAQVSAALIQQAADTAAFQTLVGAANATAAKSKLVEDSGGDPAAGAKASDGSAIDCTAVTFGIVRLLDSRRVARALLTFGWEGDAEFDLIIRATGGDLEPEAFRRARNAASDIVDQMQALFGASPARIAWGEIRPGSPVRLDDIHALRGAYFVRSQIAWRDLP